ncbi:pilus assembly protein [Vibrio sp. Sgm 22]|uniref:TadE/TadG family type IV pilus assembly protein n=1 Tax=unclassified Vibrio TaxID=2614977 RepID=UPI001EFE9B22|nr:MULTISPECIES: TadE/TadG family type IV pilus assembly protein [unclassified Vibrio]MCG9638901.1 pilus assembly protein [Vibrio sp. Isolate34]MCX2756977.1 pilus assembly protein [Vibrio sp. 14G-20]MCX2773938.1 pilus assembly protein [Vibrio sp. Sgm 22]
MKQSNQVQQGFAAVEMVIATPVLLFFLVLVLELGNILVHYNVISKSVQNGARYAVSEVYGTIGGTIAPTSEIQNVVVYGQNSAGTAVLSSLTTSDVTVTPPSGDSYVRVSVTYDYVPLFLSIPFSNESFAVPLSVTSVMRVL